MDSKEVAMGDGRQWAIEMLGEHGIRIRQRIPEMVRAEQLASADAQEASGHRGRGVFGQFSTGMREKFEEFAHLPGGALVRPGQAPYKVAVVNGVALFPWRYGDGHDRQFGDVPFATSDARAALFSLGPVAIQTELDLGLPVGELSEEDAALVALVRQSQVGHAATTLKVVVVAIACSMSGVADIRWGEVVLRTDGYLEWFGGESLTHLRAAGPTAVVDTGRTFLTGEPPQKRLRVHDDGLVGTADGDE